MRSMTKVCIVESLFRWFKILEIYVFIGIFKNDYFISRLNHRFIYRFKNSYAIYSNLPNIHLFYCRLSADRVIQNMVTSSVASKIWE